MIIILLSLAVLGCSPSSAPAPAQPTETLTPSEPPAAEFQQPAGEPPMAPLGKAPADPPPPANPLRVDAAGAAPSADVPEAPAQPPAAPAAETQPTAEKPRTRPKTGKHADAPFDPIQVNGPIFVGWPKPAAALILTGMEEGYLEPCGCAGLDRMKGGMGRRATLFRQLREQGWPAAGLDVGGLVLGFGRQAELKYQTCIEGKRKMGYDAITFGLDELRLPAGELVAAAAGVDGKPSPFVAANVGLLGRPGDITPQSKVIEVGRRKIGVTAILGETYQRQIHNDELVMTDPAAALEGVLPELTKRADFLVLLAHAAREEAEALCKKFPVFHVVVVSDGFAEPPAAPQWMEGSQKTAMISVGHKGMYAVVLGLFDDANQPMRYQRVPLDSRFAGATDMKMLMAAYQEQLKTIGLAGLGLRPVAHPLAERNGRFVGSAKCQSCHEKSHDIWRKTGHGRAFDTLVNLDPPRNFDPECISCHVTGWHPTKFFPYQSGYESREKTPHLIDAGCEACHGPGEKHAAAEMRNNEKEQETYRKAMVVTKAESKAKQCYSCHDLDNSPDFDFDQYWPFVEHYEKADEEDGGQ